MKFDWTISWRVCLVGVCYNPAGKSFALALPFVMLEVTWRKPYSGLRKSLGKRRKPRPWPCMYCNQDIKGNAGEIFYCSEKCRQEDAPRHLRPAAVKSLYEQGVQAERAAWLTAARPTRRAAQQSHAARTLGRLSKKRPAPAPAITEQAPAIIEEAPAPPPAPVPARQCPVCQSAVSGHHARIYCSSRCRTAGLAPPLPSAGPELNADALEALRKLGMNAPQARARLLAANQEHGALPTDELVRCALRVTL